MWFLTNNKLISHNQVAFKSKQSTIDSLLHIQHYASNALSTKNHVTVLSTDFEKAFDRVGIHTILSQLEKWGVGQKIFNIIKAFMTNRTFRVRINNTLSNHFNLYNGIPQGSPHSVVLFIIAFEQVSNIILIYKNISLSLYADDAIIFTKIKDIKIVNNIFLNILKK